MVLEGQGALPPGDPGGDALGVGGGGRLKVGQRVWMGPPVPGRGSAHLEAVGSLWGFGAKGEGCQGQKGQRLAWSSAKLWEIQKQPQCQHWAPLRKPQPPNPNVYFILVLFSAVPVACGSSQARDQTRATGTTGAPAVTTQEP